jgi:hypothetical protein
MTVFLRLLEADNKAEALALSIKSAESPERFECSARRFHSIPGTPFVYWLTEKLMSVFSTVPAFEANGRSARQGLGTSDDFRYVRAWWEVSSTSLVDTWRPFAKGGAFSPYYSENDLVLEWKNDGAIIKAMVMSQYGSVSKRIVNEDFYTQPGLTWPSRPHKRGGFSCVPAGTIFSVSGMMIFEEDSSRLLSTCAILNSTPYIGLLHSIMPRGGNGSGQTLKYEAGYLTAVPVPTPTLEQSAQLSELSTYIWREKRKLFSTFETSRTFTLPALLHVEGQSLSDRLASWKRVVSETLRDIRVAEEAIDELCFELYGLAGEDREILIRSVGSSSSSEPLGTEADDEAPQEIDANDVVLAEQLISWAVGVALGRFDARVASESRLPSTVEPFEDAPLCSPGMLVGSNGFPSEVPPVGYPIAGGHLALVDDPGHDQDIMSKIQSVFRVVFGSNSQAWWDEVCSLLDPKSQDLRAWMASEYFAKHVKRYSKSRRKGPVYWQLGIPSARYGVWVNAHRVNSDSLFRIYQDLVLPKLAHEESKLATARGEIRDQSTSQERGAVDELEAFVMELKQLASELKLVAPLLSTQLDDGSVLVMAPLWRLVPSNRAWQKELRVKWQELQSGKYDWAHSAMHLWPERVIAKCATDRSLAIAHGLEDVFWFEDDGGKWKPRTTPLQSIAELVAERTSSAVKDALKSLLEAPEPIASTKRTRKVKAS